MSYLHWVLLYAIIACLTAIAVIEIETIDPVLAGILWAAEVGPLVVIFLVVEYGGLYTKSKLVSARHRSLVRVGESANASARQATQVYGALAQG